MHTTAHDAMDHDRGDRASTGWPNTAEQLMRSRFEAFQTGDRDWLLTSWHPSRRPAALELDERVRWRGLQIVDVVDGGPDDETGVVDFRAAYTVDGERGLQHERSRFVREGGRRLYLDGEIIA